MPKNNQNSDPNSQLPPFGDILLQAQFTSPSQKKDKNYGRSLIARIYREQAVTTSTIFFGARQARWLENWRWAMGRQSMQEFLDLTSISGDKAYTNIDFTQNREGPQFVETLVSSITSNQESITVTAVDDGSINEKLDRKIESLYRMRDRDNIAQAENVAGVSLEPPNIYVPEDELSAEVYFELEDRLPKEIRFEQYIEKVKTDNNFKELYKRVTRDEIVVNCAAIKIEKLPNKFIGLRKCVPANLIYNFFLSDSGKMELAYIGEVYSLKVRDLRRLYGKSEYRPNGLTEKEIWQICQSATRLNVANRYNYTWTDAYLYQTDRPYDDYSITVFDCEVKVFDKDYYVSKTDSFGRENIQIKRGIPKPTSEKAEVITSDKYTVYRGVWAPDSDQMIYWGPPDVVIKPYMDISESLFSYSIQIPNNDGDYIPSLFERALEPLRELTVAKLKRKQLIAEMVPPGYTIDVEKCRDVDLGSGNILSWDEILKIRNQKGVIVWSSRGLNPNEINNQPPIIEVANAGSVAQLQELSAIIDRCIANIRTLLGVPQYRDGTDVGDRTAAKLAEGQAQSSFNVTNFISTSVASLFEEVFHKVCMIKWDEIVLQNNEDDLIDTVFQVKVEMKDAAYEKQLLEQNIQIAMQTVDGNGKPLLSFKDAFKIRQIKNSKLAELYLANMIEENEKRTSEQSMQLQQQNQQIQAAAAQQKAESDARLQQEKAQIDSMLKDAESKNRKQELLLVGFLDMIKSGSPIPPQLMPLMDATFQNVGIPIVVENDEMQKQIMMQMQQEAIAAQQEQLQQVQQGQPEQQIQENTPEQESISQQQEIPQ